MRQAAMVRAAGGVVSRTRADGLVEVLVVHRPGHDDWSLPKGKLERGETDEQCALREVWEETGLRCVLGAELPGVSYLDREGRSKLVRYWAMTVADGEAQGHNEVDAVRWLGVAEAVKLLSYPRDRELLLAAFDRHRA